MQREDFGKIQTRGLFDHIIQLDKGQSLLLGSPAAKRRLSGPAKPQQSHCSRSRTNGIVSLGHQGGEGNPECSGN